LVRDLLPDELRVASYDVASIICPALRSGPLFGPGTPVVFMTAVATGLAVSAAAFAVYRR